MKLIYFQDSPNIRTEYINHRIYIFSDRVRISKTVFSEENNLIRDRGDVVDTEL